MWYSATSSTKMSIPLPFLTRKVLETFLSVLIDIFRMKLNWLVHHHFPTRGIFAKPSAPELSSLVLSSL